MDRERSRAGLGMRCGLIAALVLLAAGALPASASTAAAPAGNPHGTQAKPVQTPPLDLNSASKAQLMKLPWIGDAEAKRIIAARPYFSKTDIVTRAGIPIGVYQAIRHQIAVVPKTMPNPRG